MFKKKKRKKCRNSLHVNVPKKEKYSLEQMQYVFDKLKLNEKYQILIV